jgi:16S rRNA (guanine527-N7)-methyltransferase
MTDPRNRLAYGINDLGLIPSETMLDQFMLYLQELEKWNQTVCNLTAINRREDVIIKHFFDSLLYLQAMPAQAKTVADIGSGAGFPGVPIKLVCPEIRLTLIESSEKKCAFLRHIVRQLQLKDIIVVHSRLENYAQTNVFDAVLSRALYSLKELADKTARLLTEHGAIIVSKGPKVQEELAALVDYSFQVNICSLPLTNIQRRLVTVRLKTMRQ